jgi:hypothetical protein
VALPWLSNRGADVWRGLRRSPGPHSTVSCRPSLPPYLRTVLLSAGYVEGVRDCSAEMTAWSRLGIACRSAPVQSGAESAAFLAAGMRRRSVARERVTTA